jgi:hypothetical protein
VRFSAVVAHVAFELLSRRPSAKGLLNDIDPGVTAVWQAVAEIPEDLKDRICNFTPSVNAFYRAKRLLLSSVPMSLMDRAFAKVVVHSLSYHGMGVMAGGPLGGADQNSPDLGVWSRWSASGFCATIDRLHPLLVNTLITTLDYKKVLSDRYLVYLDRLFTRWAMWFIRIPSAAFDQCQSCPRAQGTE